VSFDRPYDILLVFHCNYIYVSISEATLVKFCTHVGHIKLVVMAWPPRPSEYGRGYVTFLIF